MVKQPLLPPGLVRPWDVNNKIYIATGSGLKAFVSIRLPRTRGGKVDNKNEVDFFYFLLHSAFLNMQICSGKPEWR